MIIPEATAEYDFAAEIVRCRFSGPLTIKILDDFEKAFQADVKRARQRSPSVRVLFDSSKAIVQTAEVIAAFQQIGRRAWRSGDKFAVVIESALLKMQASRAMGGPNEHIFRSIEEAEAWLRS
jgi:MFS superfamily sulfate permease-like transporter